MYYFQQVMINLNKILEFFIFYFLTISSAVIAHVQRDYLSDLCSKINYRSIHNTLHDAGVVYNFLSYLQQLLWGYVKQ